MQTARVTILMTLEKKAAFDAIAAERGISTGEFLRQAGDRAANDLAKDVISIDKRVVRLETMVEVAAVQRGSTTGRLPNQ